MQPHRVIVDPLDRPRVHVGLGDVTRVEDVTVTWPDGSRESFGAFDAGATHALRRGAGQPASSGS